MYEKITSTAAVAESRELTTKALRTKQFVAEELAVVVSAPGVDDEIYNCTPAAAVDCTFTTAPPRHARAAQK